MGGGGPDTVQLHQQLVDERLLVLQLGVQRACRAPPMVSKFSMKMIMGACTPPRMENVDKGVGFAV